MEPMYVPLVGRIVRWRRGVWWHVRKQGDENRDVNKTDILADVFSYFKKPLKSKLYVNRDVNKKAT